jgi:hypothetical protein
VSVDYNDRVLVVSRTGAGKSELLNVLASDLHAQWLLVDPKAEFAIGDVEAVGTVDGLDFQHERVLHFVPDATTTGDEWEELFGRAFELRHFTMVVHEGGFTCGFQPGRVGPRQNTYLSQGRAHGLGYWVATQRPVKLPTFATSEPGHVFAFAEKMTRADDHHALAEAMDLPANDLADHQRVLLEQHGKHGFLWFDRGAGKHSGWGSLPESVRARSVVRRTSVA